MNLLPIISSAILQLALAIYSNNPDACQFQARVIGVIDGDTITVLHDKLPDKVRLAEIDCPEKKQAFGAVAKRYCADLAFGKTVYVKTSGRDRYHRLIAYVLLPDGRMLNLELVKSGLAWCYRRYSHDPAYPQAEQGARDNHIGLWSEPNPIPPWNFRHPHYQ